MTFLRTGPRQAASSTPGGTPARQSRAAASAAGHDVVGARAPARVLDDVAPPDLERCEAVVRVERSEMLVAAGLDERDDAEPGGELLAVVLVETVGHPAKLRSQEPPCYDRRRRGEPRLERRAHGVEMLTLAHHSRTARGARIIVMLRPSKVAAPSATPSSCTSSARRCSSARPRSGCSRSRPRKRTTSFTLERCRRNVAARSRFHA